MSVLARRRLRQERIAASLFPGTESGIQTGAGSPECVGRKTNSGQQQQQKKKPDYLQLVLAGVKYSGGTEKDDERNEKKDPWHQARPIFQVLAQTHSGVLLKLIPKTQVRCFCVEKDCVKMLSRCLRWTLLSPGGVFLLWTALGCEEQLSEAADTVWLHLDTEDSGSG